MCIKPTDTAYKRGPKPTAELENPRKADILLRIIGCESMKEVRVKLFRGQMFPWIIISCPQKRWDKSDHVKNEKLEE